MGERLYCEERVMRTKEDKQKQAQVMIDNALRKRRYVRDILIEAEQEMAKARALMREAENG